MLNPSKSKALLDPHSGIHQNYLKSWALWSIVKGNAVRVLDAENLQNGKFVRCEVGSIRPTGWGRGIEWVDIPEINLQKAIKFWHSGTHTRAIVWNGAWIWDPRTVKIESYNPETYELHVIGQNSGRFTLKIPVTYSSFEHTNAYHHDTDPLYKNPTEPKSDEEALEQILRFLGKVK